MPYTLNLGRKPEGERTDRSENGSRATSPMRGMSYDQQMVSLSPLQLDAGASPAADPHAVAASGLAGGGGALPHLNRIQASFGKHDVSDVKAHTAGAACDALGARGYAMDGAVGLSPGASLHTVAHEAAHVLQQRGGLALKGAMGQSGDAYERHADAVADKVVAGESAESLLDAMAVPVSGGGVVQRQALQLDKDRHRQTGTVPGWEGPINTYEVCAPEAEGEDCFGSEDPRYAEAEHQQSWSLLSPLMGVGVNIDHEEVDGTHYYFRESERGNRDAWMTDAQFQAWAEGYLSGVGTRYEGMDEGQLIEHVGELAEEYVQWVTDNYRIFDWLDRAVHVDEEVPEPDNRRLIMEAYIDAAQASSGFVGPMATGMGWFCLGIAAVATGGLALGGAVPSAGIPGAGLTFDSGLAAANTTLRIIGIATQDGWNFDFGPGRQTDHQTTVLKRTVTTESVMHRFFNENRSSVPWTVRLKVFEIAEDGFA